jgi:hypothetical protein
LVFSSPGSLIGEVGQRSKDGGRALELFGPSHISRRLLSVWRAPIGPNGPFRPSDWLVWRYPAFWLVQRLPASFRSRTDWWVSGGVKVVSYFRLFSYPSLIYFDSVCRIRDCSLVIVCQRSCMFS